MLLVATLAWWASRKLNPSQVRLYWPALGLKILAGLAVGFVHRQYYPNSDVVMFHTWSREVWQQALQDPASYMHFLLQPDTGYYTGQDRSVFFVKLLSLFALITRADYWLMSVWTSVVSFYAVWYLVQTLIRIEPKWKWPAVLAFLFLPSSIFWTSGLLKETLAVAGMWMCFAVFLKWWYKLPLSWYDYALVCPALAIAWKLKYYMVAVALPLMLAAALTRVIVQKITQAKRFGMLVLVALAFLLFLLPGLFHPNLRPGRVLHVVAENHNLMVQQHQDNLRLTSHSWLEPTASVMLRQGLPAVFNGLYAPYQPQAEFSFYMCAVAESWLLLALTALAAVRASVPQGPHRILLVGVFLYCLLLAGLLGLAVPAVGTLVRYRAAFISWWVFVLLLSILKVRTRHTPH
jgi:hypothetical protein